jgi:hypothetical protein
MSSTDPNDLPSVAAILGPVLQRVGWEQQPLLVAITERLAAQRYRQWATDCTREPLQTQLLACADREEEIAGRAEALYSDAAAIQRGILVMNPEIVEINRTIFAGRPLVQQFAIQAQGERLVAATWRALAEQERDASRRAVFLACAALEEESAAFLESLLREL